MSGPIGLPPLKRSLPSSLSISATAIVLGTGLLTGTFGCRSTREVAVRVSIPGSDSVETPASGVGVIALPYDRDSVLASLEARARAPRPPTAQLDSLFARFRGPFTAYTSATYAAAKLQDTLGLLRLRLDSTAGDAPHYRSLSAHYSRLADSLSAVELRGERARTALDRARAEFVRRSDSLRSAVRKWEDSTYQGYDSIVENLAKARGMEPATDTTGPTGWAHFSLARGRWWLYANSWDTGDPNSEWYWNVPVTADTVLLSSRTGRRRPRY